MDIKELTIDRRNDMAALVGEQVADEFVSRLTILLDAGLEPAPAKKSFVAFSSGAGACQVREE